jgi:hypothetical protein
MGLSFENAGELSRSAIAVSPLEVESRDVDCQRARSLEPIVADENAWPVAIAEVNDGRDIACQRPSWTRKPPDWAVKNLPGPA